MQYTVKEMAQKSGLSVHTIRYYTDCGLLPCLRDENNRRIFDEESFHWLQGILCLRGCGMSIDAMREYSELCREGDTEQSLQARYRIILEQRELALHQLREAQERVDYMNHKVQHYEEILAHNIPDDTNPSNWGNPVLSCASCK